MPKRYFWLKLHDDFFDSLRIKKLRRMAGGDTYTIIYLKMQLVAIKKDGVITFKGYEDDICDELALELNEDPENVKVTLAYLLSCGLCETSDSTSYYFPYAVQDTGSETTVAKRVRDYRERQKQLPDTPQALQCNTDVTDVKQKCNGEIEKEKEIEIEIEKDNKSEDAPASSKPTKHKHGTWGNVLLTDEEFAKLTEAYPNDYNERIERLSYYLASKGVSYKSHYATILNWARKDAERGKAAPSAPAPTEKDRWDAI